MSMTIHQHESEQIRDTQAGADPVQRQPVFRQILIAADGAELQNATVHAALSLSGPGSRISVLHVATSPIDLVRVAEPPEEPCEISAANDPVLDAVCEQIPAELRGQRIYREENIDREIIDVAREIGADLLVVGTHSRGIAGRLLLGSTAAYVLRHSTIPVLVVNRVAAETSISAHEPKRILIPVDAAGGPSRSAADLAARIATERDARVALVHVVAHAPEFVPEYGIMVEGSLQPYFDRRGAAFLASFPIEIQNGSAIHRIVREGEPAGEIMAAAAEWKADLIVMGTHGRRGIGRLFLGSTAEQVARHAPCPVLCVSTR